MKSGIKRFRRDYNGARLGQKVDDIFGELRKLELDILLEFDEWRKGKTIISAIPKMSVSLDIGGEDYTSLTVFYEIE